MTEPLPSFRYHPDPVAAGSIEPSDAVCRCCGRARGYIYAGPVCAEEEFDDALCPWCITDGQAAARFAASLHRRGRGGEPWRLGRRARGRGERGRRAHARLHRLAAQADIGFAGEEWEEYLAALDADGSPSAYLFRCRHCGQLGGYSDFH